MAEVSKQLCEKMSKIYLLITIVALFCVSRWGRMCGSPRSFARVVGGGCAGAVRGVRLTRPLEPVERQGGDGQAFFFLYGGSPAAPGGEGGVVTKKDQGTDLGPFLCYSALICSSVRPVACWMTSFDRLISSIRRAICSASFSIPFFSA